MDESNDRGISEFDLFNNPMVDAAREAMSEADIERYRVLGEEMFKIDFSGIDHSLSEDVIEPLLYILESVKSGLHPSMLTNEEKVFLNEYASPKWYKQFGYKKRDLESFVESV